MLSISGTRADDFDIMPTSASSDSSSNLSSSRSIFNRSRSSSQPPSPSSLSTPTSSQNSSFGFASKRPSSVSHLCYSQEFVEYHLKSMAEIEGAFEIRKILLVGACRMFTDFLINYKKPKSDDVMELLRVKIEFIRTECKKLSLVAETIY